MQRMVPSKLGEGEGAILWFEDFFGVRRQNG
jgi:hypothetical protein